MSAFELASAGGGGGAELAYAEFTAEVVLGTDTVVVTAPAVSLDGSTKIVAEFFCPVWAGNADIGLELFDAVDGGGAVSVGQVFHGQTSPTGYVDNGNIMTRTRLVPASGSHVYSIRGTSTAGSVYASTGGANTRLPGYIRVIEE